MSRGLPGPSGELGRRLADARRDSHARTGASEVEQPTVELAPGDAAATAPAVDGYSSEPAAASRTAAAGQSSSSAERAGATGRESPRAGSGPEPGAAGSLSAQLDVLHPEANDLLLVKLAREPAPEIVDSVSEFLESRFPDLPVMFFGPETTVELVDEDSDLRSVAATMAGCIRSVLESLPFQAPEAVASMVHTKLRFALSLYESAACPLKSSALGDSGGAVAVDRPAERSEGPGIDRSTRCPSCDGTNIELLSPRTGRRHCRDCEARWKP